MFLLFYVRIYFKVQHIPLIIRDLLSAKVGINMHALVLFICGLYQMPASVYELMVQLFPMILLFHSLYHHFYYLSESLSCHASSGSRSLWSLVADEYSVFWSLCREVATEVCIDAIFRMDTS